MDRDLKLQQLVNTQNWSVVIIGGGINGVATWRDLALQGVDALLVEQNDYCSGTSAASSHMVHGGIRYLENGEFRLVNEAVNERNRLLQNAPHAVKPLPTTIPIFTKLSGLLNAPLKFLGLLDKPSERGTLVIKIGIMLYEWYARGTNTMPKHTLRNNAQSLAAFPALNPEVTHTATYYDAMMPSPERICIDLIRDMDAHPNALAFNYMAATASDGQAITLTDTLTGQTYAVTPQVVINAAGPWIDFANDRLGTPTKFIGGTKGSHLVLDHPELRAAIGDNEFFFENHDGRIVLIYPLYDRVMIGTSDIAIDNPDDAVTTDAEIDYFMEMTAKVFPNIKISREDIVFQFSGVRPLPASDAKSTGQISRDHQIKTIDANADTAFPILNLIGGKWTTFRAFAEQSADAALKLLGLPRKLSTQDHPIGGGQNYPLDPESWAVRVARETGIQNARASILFERYGTVGASVAKTEATNTTPVVDAPDYTHGEIHWLVQNEQCQHLDDILLRRTMLGMLGQTTAAMLQDLAAIMQPLRGWTTAETQAEIVRTTELLHRKHGVVL